MSTRKPKRKYTVEELYNPQIDLSRDGVAYGRQSSKDQVVKNVQSHISQTVMLLGYTRDYLGFCDNGSTGTITLFVENQIVDDAGNMSIKNASGTWPIDKRPGLKTICDLIESGKIGVVVAEYVDRLFRDEDRIDSNIFIKICRENNCYVHISSKRMTYNFANRQHAEMFRLEVQMAAAYIETHVRDTMLRRRDMAAESGQWAGFGSIPVNFIVDRRKESPTFKRMIPYQPHAEISVALYDRLIELAFDLGALCEELIKQPYIYPEFESWTYVGEYTVRSNLKKTSGQGYHLTRKGLEHMFCNIANIGGVEQKGKVLYGHHEPIIDEARFWLVYDHLKKARPEGAPTGKSSLKRYTQRRSRGTQKIRPLLHPETTRESGHVYFTRDGTASYGSYAIFVRTKGLLSEYELCVNAQQLETVVVNRMFEHLRVENLGDLKAVRTARSEKLAKRLKELQREEHVIEGELAHLNANLRQLTIPSVVKETEASMARVLARKEGLLQEREQLLKQGEDQALRTLEEELSDLEDLWPQKPFSLKEGILKVLIKRVIIDQMSPKFFRVVVEWKYGDWGREQIYLMQKGGGRRKWTEHELEVLQEVYPRKTQRLCIMQALPSRSWRAIQQMAGHLNLSVGTGHGTGIRYGKGDVEDFGLSWNDIRWLEEVGLSFKSFSSKEVGWTNSSSSISTPVDIMKLIAEVRILLKKDRPAKQPNTF